MSDTASKETQEAYVNSLYRMTQEQLIAEVMRVQMAAADLIKAEVESEREACAVTCEELETANPAHVDRNYAEQCADAIRSRGNKLITQ